MKQNDATGCNQLPCSEEAVWCSRDGKGINRGAHSLMVNQSRKTGNDFTAGNSARRRSNTNAARPARQFAHFFFFLEPKYATSLRRALLHLLWVTLGTLGSCPRFLLLSRRWVDGVDRHKPNLWRRWIWKEFGEGEGRKTWTRECHQHTKSYT